MRDTKQATTADRTIILALVVFAVLAACAPRDGAVEKDAIEPSYAITGTLRGRVYLRGAVTPEQPLIQNTTDPDVCGSVQRAGDLLVDPETRGIANVIVALRGALGDHRPTAAPSRLVLENRDCQFVPRVAVLTVGSTIEALSHDEVLHTVHLYGALERNMALPAPSVSMTVAVEEPGMIAVLCDVHGWMKAYVRVDAHPFHAVTDERGGFVIHDFPAGNGELDVWHERLGSQTLAIHVDAGAVEEVEIGYSLAGDDQPPDASDTTASIGRRKNDGSTGSKE